MNNRLVSRRIVAAASGLVLAAVLFARAQQGPPLAGKKAEEAYKNILVLKGAPAEQVVPAMRVIAGSLGVGCNFCHVAGDFAKDDMDSKRTARSMITMMMDINKNNFNGEQRVTCFTCHNGSNNPAATLQFADMATAPQEGGRGGGRGQGPAADQILANYVQALGGEPAIRKIATLTITATRDAPAAGGAAAEAGPPAGGPPQAQVEEYFKAPNLMVTIVHAPNGMTTENGFDGTTGWAQNARGAVADLTGTDQSRAKRAANIYEPVELSKEYGNLMTRGTAKVGDHTAYVVIGTPQGDQQERLFFDTTTGLLVRKIVIDPTPVGNSPVQTDYDDYRDVGGVKMPFMIRVTAPPNNRITTHVQKVDTSAPIDSSKFAKPPSKAAQAQ